MLAGTALLSRSGGEIWLSQARRPLLEAPPALVAARSPAETVTLLHSLYQRRDYDGIAPYVVAERRDGMIAILKAIDEVLSANAESRKAAKAAYTDRPFDALDLSVMADNLGPFSARVRLISQRFKGDVAVVTLQEGDHVPVVHAEFGWWEGRWQYHPERAPTCLAAELRALAAAMRELRDSVNAGASFTAYRDTLEQQVFPQMARVVTARDGEVGAVAAAPESGD